MDCCRRVPKFVLFLFNGIFGVLGLVLMVLGLWLRFSKNTRTVFEMQELNSSTFITGVVVMITLGSILMTVAMFGICRVCSVKKEQDKRNCELATRCSLRVFVVLVAALALAEIIVGALAYSRSKQAKEALSDFYVNLHSQYVAKQDTSLSTTLRAVHNMLHCCGVTGSSLKSIVKETCPKPPLQTELHDAIVFPMTALLMAVIFLKTDREN